MTTTTQPDAVAAVALDPNVWHIDGPHIEITLSTDAIAFLNDLLRDTRNSPEELFRKSLGLYRLAVDAHLEGKAIGAASSPEALDHEFVL